MQYWTYDELTTAIETEIRRQLDKADLGSDLECRKRREYALGAYLAWEAIVRLHPSERNVDNARRLRELIDMNRQSG